MDLSKFEQFAAERWIYESKGATVRGEDFQKHIADIRGLGRLTKEVGPDKAIEVQDLIGEFIASAPEMLRLLILYAELTRALDGIQDWQGTYVGEILQKLETQS